MFSMDIVGSDVFLDMPPSAQALYFHLGMRADDDGFIGNFKSIQRILGSSDDEVRILFAKRFLLNFEDGVIVVKHWLINNTIRKDRYNATKYVEHKNRLFLKKNKSYSDNKDSGIPLGNQLATQNRIEEKSIDRSKDPKKSKELTQAEVDKQIRIGREKLAKSKEVK